MIFSVQRKKEGEPLHISGGIEADGKAVGLMQHPPGGRRRTNPNTHI